VGIANSQRRQRSALHSDNAHPLEPTGTSRLQNGIYRRRYRDDGVNSRDEGDAAVIDRRRWRSGKADLSARKTILTKSG
jgi:hypothetical protein